MAKKENDDFWTLLLLVSFVMTQTFQFNFDDEASEREEVVIEKHNFQDKMNLSLRISYHHQPLFHFTLFYC